MINLLVNLGTLGGDKGQGFGPFGKPGDFASSVGLFQKIFSNVIALMTIGGGLWFIFQFIVGAYNWLTSGGDKGALKNAQDRLTHAVSGLIILVTAYALISIIGELVGFSILNPYESLKNIVQ